MKKFLPLAVALVCLVDLTGCESPRYAPPPVVEANRGLGGGPQTDITMLREGRSLFVHRCIECHTLPPFWYYTTEEWPKLVDSMAQRSHLKSKERDAIIAYILAVRRE